MKITPALPVVVAAKKVSRSGSITGLKAMAGKKILIVAPNGLPEVSVPATALLEELGKDLRKQGRRALGQYRRLRERHFKTQVPGTKQLLQVLPAEARPALQMADAWVRARAARFEKRAERLLSR